MTTERQDELSQDTMIAPAKVRISAREIDAEPMRRPWNAARLLGWVGVTVLVALVV